jgi:hypothetical protein
MIYFIQCILILYLTSLSAYAAIPATYSLNSDVAQNIIKTIDSTTIVLINIDKTIVAPKSKMFRYSNNPYRTFIQDLTAQAKNMPVFNHALSAFLQRRKIILVEPEWPSFIEKLKSTGALVLGLYQTMIMEHELIKDPQEWHYQELKYFGVNFTDKINGKELITLGPKKDNSFFYKGILFTGALSKNGALIEFMKVSNIMPRKIVAIDPRIDDLKQTEYALRVFDIEYYPIQYLAEQEIAGIPNSDVVKLQQDNLLANNQWLEDDEAEQLLLQQQSEQK